MKILILGTGYVGSEIASSLSKNHIVTCIDHGNNFSDFSGKLENIKLVKGEIQNKNLIKEFSKDVDLICYCINTGGVVDCMENSELYKKINVDDFQELLESIENKNCHFLLLSTSFVYSNSEKNYEDSVTKPLTLYGKFRLEQESLLTKSNFPYTILRIANIYGHQNFLKRFLTLFLVFILRTLKHYTNLLSEKGRS